MLVRLGFAIAAHLEPEILVLDEVLAVGDAEFQKKALGKVQNVSSVEGRTVLFVSHNMQAISTLCTRVILIDKGYILQDDETSKVVRNYLMFETMKNGSIEWSKEDALGDTTIKLRAIKILDQDNNIRNHFFSKSKIRVQFDFEIYTLDKSLVVGFDLTNEDGIVIFRSYHNDSDKKEWPEFKTGKNSIYCDIPGELLREGTYYICPKISLHAIKWIINSDPLLSFDVELNHGLSPLWTFYNKSNRPGVLALIVPWKNVN
jgi:lipopolysaccharide transport system ATP-binding protein